MHIYIFPTLPFFQSRYYRIVLKILIGRQKNGESGIDKFLDKKLFLEQKSGVFLLFLLLTSSEPNILRMLFSIKNWLANKPVFSMKYWHGWLVVITVSTWKGVFSNNQPFSWRERVHWPTKGTGGLQHHIFFYFWRKIAS